MDALTQVLFEISRGEHDDMLNVIEQAIQDRRDGELSYGLTVHDFDPEEVAQGTVKVRMTKDCPVHYLRGQTATVVAINKSRISIKFDNVEATRRYGEQPSVRTNPKWVEII